MLLEVKSEYHQSNSLGTRNIRATLLPPYVIHAIQIAWITCSIACQKVVQYKVISPYVLCVLYKLRNQI